MPKLLFQNGGSHDLLVREHGGSSRVAGAREGRWGGNVKPEQLPEQGTQVEIGMKT